MVVASEFLRLAEEESKNTGWKNDMTPLKFLKLVYLAHGYYLATLDKPFIFEDIEAWTYGPVIPELYRRIKHFDQDVVTKIDDIEPDDIRLNELEKAHIKCMFGLYRDYTGPMLSNITHKEGTPWRDIYDNLKHASSVVISNDNIKKYYLKLVDKN
jgi:uncharacterized phage-associated protein